MADLNGLIDNVIKGDNFDVIRDIGNIPAGQTISQAWFTVKEEFWDSASKSVINKSIDTTVTINGYISDIGDGDGVARVIFALQEVETLGLHEYFRYVYDIQVKTSAGKVFTPEYGTFIVHPSVTNAEEPNITRTQIITGVSNIA